MKGQAQTKQEAAKVFERHGSRKRAAAASTPAAAKRRGGPAAAQPPHTSHTMLDEDGAEGAAAAAEVKPLKRRGASEHTVDTAGAPSIKSFFAPVSDRDAKAEAAAAPAAQRTRAATRGSAAPGAITKFFTAAGGRSSDVIVIDD